MTAFQWTTENEKKSDSPHFDFLMSINGLDNKKGIITWGVLIAR